MNEPGVEDDNELIESTDEGEVAEADWTSRVQRQSLIREYQRIHGSRLMVFIGEILYGSTILVEELLRSTNENADLHLLLQTPGGDGEAAVRLVRQLQSRCRELTIAIPHEAKSAGTLFALGAHHIVMGPISDLGPVDPQIALGDLGYVPAKSIVAAFQYAERATEAAGEVAAFHVQTLANHTALLAQVARETLDHTDVLMRQALAANPDRSPAQVEQLAGILAKALLSEPQSHSAIVSANDAQTFGLPIVELNSESEHWQRIWQLWTHYLEVPQSQIYESADASHTFDLE